MTEFLATDVEFRVHKCDCPHFFDVVFTSLFEDFNIGNGFPVFGRESILVWQGTDRRIKFRYEGVIFACDVVRKGDTSNVVGCCGFFLSSPGLYVFFCGYVVAGGWLV